MPGTGIGIWNTEVKKWARLESSWPQKSCEELTHWKRLWCWEGLGAGGEGDDRGWDGWMASPPWWAWVWVNSRSWWWTGRLGVLWFMGSQRVGYDSATELNWTEFKHLCSRKNCLLLIFVLCNHYWFPRKQRRHNCYTNQLNLYHFSVFVYMWFIRFVNWKPIWQYDYKISHMIITNM